MAKNTEKRKRLKKQQKERTAYNKERKAEREQELLLMSQAFLGLEGTSLAATDWLYREEEKQQITFVLNHLDNYDICFMEYKLIEAIQGLIQCCEQQYSEELRRDQEWKNATVLAVIGKYKKDPYVIQEIENYKISSERKIFLYIECLKRELEKGLIVEIIENICRQMQDSFIKQCCIFILSWAEIMYFLTTKHIGDGSLKRLEFQYLEERSQSLFTDWKQYNEDFYGLSVLMSEDSENEEFSMKNEEVQPLFLVEDGLLYLRTSDDAEPFMYVLDDLPEQISQSQYDNWMSLFLDGILRSDMLYIPNMEEYLIKITTAMLVSEDWEDEMRLILLHKLRMFVDYLWKVKDLYVLKNSIALYLHPKSLLISNQPYIHRAGSGNLMSLIYAENGIVLLRSERWKMPYIVSSYSFPGMIVQEILRDYGTERNREIFINWDSYPEDGFLDNIYYNGWGLYEMTMAVSVQEKRHAGWKRINHRASISEKKNYFVRDRSMEAELLDANKQLDLVDTKEYVCTAIPQNAFEADMKKGVEAYRCRRYVEAAEEFLNLLDKYPEEGMLYYYIANSFSYMSENWADCLEYSLHFYQKALTLIDYVEVWVDYGNALRVMRKTEEAIAVLEEARSRFRNEGSPAMILSSTYPDADRRKAMESESVRKRGIQFNKTIREWESKHQLLKEQTKDFI